MAVFARFCHESGRELLRPAFWNVVYGAGSLWQWRLDTQEEHQEWCILPNQHWSAGGNPCRAVQLAAHFSCKHRTVPANGFYGDDGV